MADLSKSFILNLDEIQEAACVIPGSVTLDPEESGGSTRCGYVILDMAFLKNYIEKTYSISGVTMAAGLAPDSPAAVLVNFIYSGQIPPIQ